jgi:hypothetical protein
MLDEPNRTACKQLLNKNRKLFSFAPGSSHNHQAWEGGYLEHIVETMNIACVLYSTMNKLRPLPFSLASALLVLFLHDLEKPWKYKKDDKGFSRTVTKNERRLFREELMSDYGIILTEEETNGMRYVEGELEDYSSKHRVMGPLAGFCHLCDVTSARIWFDQPAGGNDPWSKKPATT